MTNEECFGIWAPEGSRWSAWAKPALFAHLHLVVPRAEEARHAGDFFWVPTADGRTAIVVDIAGADSVLAGIALARRGYRPVPLYNTSIGVSALVDAESIAREIVSGAETMRGLVVSADAPPAFLLDSRRSQSARAGTPGDFDNRWVVFRQDFPSGVRLGGSGVTEVLLIHDGSNPQVDLEHVLFGWQEAGLRITSAAPAGGVARPLTLSRPSAFRDVFHQLATLAGLRRNAAGGFGGPIPRPAEHSHRPFGYG